MEKNAFTQEELNMINELLLDYRYQLGFDICAMTDERTEQEIEFVDGIIKKVNALCEPNVK